MEERLEAPVDELATLAAPVGLRPHGDSLEPFGRPSAARRGRPGGCAMYRERRADPPDTGSHAIH